MAKVRTGLDSAVEIVRKELQLLVADSGIELAEIVAESSLIDDLALDSLKFVDLALVLERAFGLREFPMQDWIDSEAQKTEGGFSVLALAQACVEARGLEAGAA